MKSTHDAQRSAARSTARPDTKQRQNRFVAFSALVFLAIFGLSSIAFWLSVRQLTHESKGHDLTKTVEIQRHRLEALVNSDVAIVRKMSTSPIIRQYFLDPDDTEFAEIAIKDIQGYRSMLILTSSSLFWVNERDRKFMLDGKEKYTVDPEDPELYWYNWTMFGTSAYNFNIDFDPYLKVTNIWINAPVRGPDNNPLGILGIGVNLTDFLNSIFNDYSESAELFFFNKHGEITGAKRVDLVESKATIAHELGPIGEDIVSRGANLHGHNVLFIKFQDHDNVAALAYIPALDWYVVATHHFTFADTLDPRLTVVFAVVMGGILLSFVLLNVFVAFFLKSLNRTSRAPRVASR